MYLTIFVPQHRKPNISFEEVLANPYMIVEPIKNDPIKITREINETYARKLLSKSPIFNWGSLSGITDKVTEEYINEHYRHFTIPKRSDPNKVRQINAPDSELDGIQRQIKTFIESTNIQCHNAAYAYVNNKDTVKANQKHQENKSKWFLQLDLKDFFPSINGEFLFKQLKQVYPLALMEDSYTELIIKYALLNDGLPQGTCLSPILSNLAMVPIDYKIHERIKNYNRHHYVYTRYADDITISCKQKFDPQEIIDIIKEVFEEEEAPFKINDDKTRFGSSSGRNYHLGIIINKDNQLSIGHEKNNKFRAMIYQWCTKYIAVNNGLEEKTAEFIKETQQMRGLMSYYNNIEPDFVKKVIGKYNNKFGIDINNASKSIIRP